MFLQLNQLVEFFATYVNSRDLELEFWVWYLGFEV
jgi:hypothetical protein